MDVASKMLRVDANEFEKTTRNAIKYQKEAEFESLARFLKDHEDHEM